MSRGLVVAATGFIAHDEPVDIICCACGDTVRDRMTECTIAVELWETGDLVVNASVHRCTNPEIIERRPIVSVLLSSVVEQMRSSVPSDQGKHP